jgi:VIT1/CCC1 family predicted Fe2+/Mn2+ transporter
MLIISGQVGVQGPSMTLIDRLTSSFKGSIGDIVFGMEDGTVSIFGLVFGMALSAPDSRAVLLAGATGAAAAAVSMMAGSYLDAKSEADAAAAQAARSPQSVKVDDEALASRITDRLLAAGGASAGTDALRRVLASPGAVAALRDELSPASPRAAASPAAHALWMFASDLFAGAVPVIPFALLPLSEARIVCLAVTVVLLIALGVGRGLVAGRNVVRTTVETLFVAASAAIAGIGIGWLVS